MSDDETPVDFAAMIRVQAKKTVARDPNSLCTRHEEILAKAASPEARAFLETLLAAGESAEIKRAGSKGAGQEL